MRAAGLLCGVTPAFRQVPIRGPVVTSVPRRRILDYRGPEHPSGGVKWPTLMERTGHAATRGGSFNSRRELKEDHRFDGQTARLTHGFPFGTLSFQRVPICDHLMASSRGTSVADDTLSARYAIIVCPFPLLSEGPCFPKVPAFRRKKAHDPAADAPTGSASGHEHARKLDRRLDDQTARPDVPRSPAIPRGWGASCRQPVQAAATSIRLSSLA
jgi:hypothetical protein